jgi:hypothetical protein
MVALRGWTDEDREQARREIAELEESLRRYRLALARPDVDESLAGKLRVQADACVRNLQRLRSAA